MNLSNWSGFYLAGGVAGVACHAVEEGQIQTEFSSYGSVRIP
jgi:hypothetical protein